MKGSFFVVFMISLSIGAVLTAFILEKIGHVRKLYSGKAIVFLWAFATLVFLWYAVAFPYIALHSFTGDTQLVGIVSLSVVLGLFLAAPPVGVLGMVFFFRAWRKPKGEKIGDVAGVSRREFVTRAAFAVPIVTMGAAAFCNVQGSRHLALTRHTLYFPDLPDYLNGYRIAQISDPHMGLFFRPQQLGEAMELAAYAGADRLEITGDLIDELSLLRPCRDILQEKGKLFRDGMDFCYGNHEYYRNVEKNYGDVANYGYTYFKEYVLLCVGRRRRRFARPWRQRSAIVLYRRCRFQFCQGEEVCCRATAIHGTDVAVCAAGGIFYFVGASSGVYSGSVCGTDSADFMRAYARRTDRSFGTDDSRRYFSLFARVV